MRQRTLTSVVLIALLLTSPIPAAVPQAQPPASSGSGSQGPSEFPPLNLLYDDVPTWDWRSPTYWINFVGGNGYLEIQSPFEGGVEGLGDRDYEPEDGWELMARHFGDETEIVNTPFLILYNKYRGTVRFIVYIHGALHENFSWGRITMRFAGSSSTTKNLTSRNVLYPLSRFADDDKAGSMVSIISLQDGWNYSDFTVQYDPDVYSVIEPMFVFDIDGVSESTLTLEGVALTAPLGVTNSDGSSSGVWEDVVTGFNAGRKAYTTTDKFITDNLSKLAEKAEDADQKSKLESIAQHLVEGKVVVAALAAIVGIAEAFLGSKKSDDQTVVEATSTSLELEGSILAQDNIATISLRVPGANHNGKPNALPLWDYPLGVIAVLSDPGTAYVTSDSEYRDIAQGNPCFTCVAYLTGFDYMDVLQLNGPVAYELNDQFPGHLLPRSVEAAWSFSVPHPKPESIFGVSGHNPPYYGDWVDDLVDAGRYRIIGSADVYDINFYEYRTQYADIGTFHTFRPEVSRLFLHAEPWNSMGFIGVTAPVMIKARFAIPGRPPKDDPHVVLSYDLWWPDSSPLPPGGDFPEVTPIWKEAAAPTQVVLSPNGGEVYAQGAAIPIVWDATGDSVTDVDLFISGDDGQSYVPNVLPSEYPNTGEFVYTGSPSPGDGFRIKVRTNNDPATSEDESDASFTIWGIEASSIGATAAAYCAGTATIGIEATWATTYPTGQADRIETWRVGTPGTVYSGETTPPSATTGHAASVELPCVAGTYRYRVSSMRNGDRVEGNTLSVPVASCPSCPPGGGGGGKIDIEQIP